MADADHRAAAAGPLDPEGRPVRLVTADDVEAYLRAHPEFLLERPELAQAISLPRPTGPGVVDMQHVMMGRLRKEIDGLRSIQSELIENTKLNQSTQHRIHAAVLAAIQANSFERLIHVVTHELPGLLDVDFVTLAIEATADAPRRAPVRGVYVLAPGAIDAALGVGRHARLRNDILGEEAFFGAAARDVQSDVLVRLRVSTGSPDGVICFGARDPRAFDPEQSTELLFFLTTVLENTIRAWLDLPE